MSSLPFDIVYVINLRERSDRWTSMCSQLAACGLACEASPTRRKGDDLTGGHVETEEAPFDANDFWTSGAKLRFSNVSLGKDAGGAAGRAVVVHDHVDEQLLQRIPVVHVEAVRGAACLPQLSRMVQAGLLTPLGAQRALLPESGKVWGMDLTPGAIGCALSHFLIWHAVAAMNAGGAAPGFVGGALVLEDDCLIPTQFLSKLGHRWSFVPPDWQLVYLSGLDTFGKGPRLPYFGRQAVPTGTTPSLQPSLVRAVHQLHRTTNAYVVNASGARRLLELCCPLTFQLDTQMTMHCAEDNAASRHHLAARMVRLGMADRLLRWAKTKGHEASAAARPGLSAAGGGEEGNGGGRATTTSPWFPGWASPDEGLSLFASDVVGSGASNEPWVVDPICYTMAPESIIVQATRFGSDIQAANPFHSDPANEERQRTAAADWA